MQTTLALAALAAVAYAAPGAVTSDISPTASAPAGFATTYPGEFQITAVNVTIATAKRDISQRDACPTANGTLLITLTNGKLTDEAGRTGYIASNYQFQFDKPPQAGAIYTDGFSVGTNSSLALGGSAVFYECLSGGFYNLYDRKWAAQCYPILIDTLPCGASSSAVTSSGVTSTKVASGAITESSDGQPAATGKASVVTQITDGQPQAASALPITEITDGQPQAPTSTAIAISELSDGQPQAPTATIKASTVSSVIAISQLSDGQPQAPTSTVKASTVKASTVSSAIAISQLSDGQPQAPTSTVKASTVKASTVSSVIAISQLSDGQPQAPTSTVKASTVSSVVAISQLSDGQPQAPTSTVVAKVSGGALATSNGTFQTATPSQITVSGGNAVTIGTSFFAAVLGLAAALL